MIKNPLPCLAGPIFQALPPNKRLDASDAAFVDVVHTNQGEAGYLGPVGAVDFFINGGGPSPQPECSSPTNITNCMNFNLITYFHVTFFINQIIFHFVIIMKCFAAII